MKGGALFSGGVVGSAVSPRQVLVGEGASGEIGGALRRDWGVEAGDVLVVADPDVVRFGLVGRAVGSLGDAGFGPVVYEDVMPEPDLPTAERVVAAVRAGRFAAVVGIGGGSAMDLAKIAAALATNPGSVEEYARGKMVRSAPLPLALIPTTAGTGAESSPNAMVTVGGQKMRVSSPLLVPILAVLDPVLTKTLPPRVTAATGLDAVSHLVEGYLSTRSNDLTDTLALTGIELVARFLPEAYSEGSNMQARRGMLTAAYLGGLVLSAGAVLGHSIGYTIASRAHLPHGVTSGMALPYCIAYNLPALVRSGRYEPLAEAFLGRSGADPQEFVRAVHAFSLELGFPPSLEAVGIGSDQIGKMADECLSIYPRPNNPVPFDRERLERMYAAMATGRLEGLVEEMLGA